MLRPLFALALIAVGALYAIQGPYYALLFYVGNAYFRPDTWDWTGIISRLNISFYGGGLVLLMTLLSRPRFVLNGRVLLLLAFLLHTLLATLFSRYVDASWPAWVEFAKALVITYLLVVLITDLPRLRLLFLVMVLALGLLQAKQGWYYLVSPPTWGSNANPVPFLGDNNGVAVGMLMLVPVIAYLAQTAEYVWARRFYWFLLIGCLFRALSTYSRGGFLACALLAGLYLYRTPYKARAGLALLVVALMILPALPASFWARMGTIQTYEEDASATGRLHFWGVAITMANAHPVFGVGHNAYNTAYNAFDTSDGEYGSGRSVHSSWFGVLAEAGYVGMGLYLAMFVCALRNCQRVRQRAARGSVPEALGQAAFALEAGLLAFAVGGSFVPFQYNEMLWHFLGIAVALGRLAETYAVSAFEWDEASQEGSELPVRQEPLSV